MARLAGWRLTGREMYDLRLATHFVPSSQLPSLDLAMERLVRTRGLARRTPNHTLLCTGVVETNHDFRLRRSAPVLSCGVWSQRMSDVARMH